MDAFEIQKLVSSLTLTDLEDPQYSLKENELKEGNRECKGSLIGKFISTLDLQIHNYIQEIQNIWGCEEFDAVREGKNVFQLFITNAGVRKYILTRGPWCFRDILFCDLSLGSGLAAI